MAKYIFKVYTKDKKEYHVKLKELENANLQAIDKFTIENGSFLDLKQLLASKLAIPDKEIANIYILNLRKQTEFSIIISNQYLKNILLDIFGNQEIIASHHYIKMKNYLFENLDSDNYRQFLDNVYTYNNQFKTLLTKYATVNSQASYSEEEMLHARTLRTLVEKKLKDYKNFRGLCVCRKRSESLTYTPAKKATNLIVASPALNPSNYNLNYNTNYKFKSIEERTADYNNEYEEYLSPKEFSDAYDLTLEDSPQKNIIKV